MTYIGGPRRTCPLLLSCSAQQLSFPSSVFYNLSMLSVKASILFFFLRFASTNRPFRIAVYFILFITVGYCLTAGFSFLYLCSPISKLWDASVDGTCVDIYTAFLANSILNATTDVIILLLPIWLLYPLRMRLRQKAVIGLAIMPGGLCVLLPLLKALPLILEGTWFQRILKGLTERSALAR